MSPEQETRERQGRGFRGYLDLHSNEHDPRAIKQWARLREGLRGIGIERGDAARPSFFQWEPIGRQILIDHPCLDQIVMCNVPPQANGLVLGQVYPQYWAEMGDPAFLMLETMGVKVAESRGKDTWVRQMEVYSAGKKCFQIETRVGGEVGNRKPNSIDKALALALGCCPEDVLEKIRVSGIEVAVKTQEMTEERIVGFAVPGGDTLKAASCFISNPPDRQEDCQAMIAALTDEGFNPVRITFDMGRSERGTVGKAVHLAGSCAKYAGLRWRRFVREMAEHY